MEDNTQKNISSSFLDAWDQCLVKLHKQVNPQVFKAYIAPLVIQDFNEELAVALIYAPSKLVARHVDQNFKFLISSNLNDILGHDINLKFQVNPNVVKKEQPIIVVKNPCLTNIPQQPQHAPQQANNTINYTQQSNYQTNKSSLVPQTNNGQSKIPSTLLNPNYRFSHFVVGNNNQFCHAAAEQVAQSPGLVYNPLFMYGGTGLGKTHLLHAIGNEVLANHPTYQVVYLSAEQFMNDLVQSLRLGTMEAFRERMRNINVLLIDDIQFLMGKDRTQEEFFHTFNALYNAKHQIVITSDKMPQDIPGIEERLLTRFSWGLIADLQAPDFETRVAILKRKAESENFFLDENVAHWIAEHIFSNVRELEGALTRLHAFSSLQKVPISIELAESVFQHLYKPKKSNITVEDIKGAVANQFNIKVSDIISKRRTRNLSFPRHIAMYLCRKHTTCSYPEIGAKFGGRDHSSVIHATNVVSKKLDNDSDLSKIIKEIERILLN